MKLEVANQMTMQQLCDYAIQKMVEQGERCGVAGSPETITGAFNCAYGIGEKHCGIGWMLDPTNKRVMDYLGDVESLNYILPEIVPRAIKDNLEFAKEFQTLHDEPRQSVRTEILSTLHYDYKLDISNPAYQQWVGMGDEE